MTASVSIALTAHELFLTVNGKTHVRLLQSEFLGLQSWIVTDGSGGPGFKIEVYTRSGRDILLEYDHREMWAAVLRELNRLYACGDGAFALDC